MEKNMTFSAHEKPNNRFLDAILLSSVVFFALTSLVNLVIFLVEKKVQLLPIAGGTILFAILFFFLRRLATSGRIFLTSILASTVWGGYFLLHAIFWENVLISLIIGSWFLPLLLAQNLRSWLRRLVLLLLALAISLLLVAASNEILIERLRTDDLQFMRLIAPVYVTVFFLFIFQVSLGSFYNRGLITRTLSALVILVFIPIATLTIVSYYNSIISDTQAATRLLSQIIVQKNNAIETWSTVQTAQLETPLKKSGTFSGILEVLDAHTKHSPLPIDQLEMVTQELKAVINQSSFEEIFILDKRGYVVISTRGDLVGKDYRYMEFFWQGKIGPTIIPPRYYPQEDQVSIFVSRPIRSYSGEVVGVLSGRTTIDPILSIINEPVDSNYQSGAIYLVNAESILLNTSRGKPTQTLTTEGAIALSKTHASGEGRYTNTDGIPVIGAYYWNSNLKIGLIAEAAQTEVYQQLSAVINTNISIAIAAFILAVIASLAIVRSITVPINALVQTSQQVISGNLGARAEVESEDEIGMLAKAFNEMTDKLEAFVANLEARVEERTIDLQQRSLELQTAAQIARDASLASNMDDLLNRTARLIRDRFGFYHVGIFLNDANNEYAVLRAAAGDAGQVMLANKHKLLIGATGIVGYVAKWGEARIALDVGADAVHFRNPLLPYTRSEMALPLKIGATVLGVLDVQSEKVNAFDQNDITIMGILVDQLAIAIERTRLLQESRQNAQALEQALRGQTARAWREYLERLNKPRGYRYEGSRIEPLDAAYIEEIKQNVSAKPIILSDNTKTPGITVLIPIRLRGQVLGGMKISFNLKTIPPETVRLLEEAANRLSLALENARLIRDAQRAAAQEQQINIISGQIQQSTDLEIILQRAVQELGRTLGVPTTFIQVGLIPFDLSENKL